MTSPRPPVRRNLFVDMVDGWFERDSCVGEHFIFDGDGTTDRWIVHKQPSLHVSEAGACGEGRGGPVRLEYQGADHTGVFPCAFFHVNADEFVVEPVLAFEEGVPTVFLVATVLHKAVRSVDRAIHHAFVVEAFELGEVCLGGG